MQIISGNLDDPKVVRLLNEHLAGMADTSPPESIHALSVDQLMQPDVSFWSLWDGDELMGCGALKELDATHGEIKSMRTGNAHLGKGVASKILQHMIGEAKRRRYTRLSLETGSGEAFAAAHSLYEKFGFKYCGPFADYRKDEFSEYMTLELRT